MGDSRLDREELVARYMEFPITDVRRERVARAYASLTGDSLELAVKRKQQEAAPKTPPEPILPPDPIHLKPPPDGAR